MSTPPSLPADHTTARPTTPTTMQAVVREAYGHADVLDVRTTAVPTPADGEVLVRVHAAGIDRGAVHIMTGHPYLMRLAGMGLRRPKQHGLGSELSGVVEKVGPGVTGFQPGHEVYGVGTATFAQYTIANAKTLTRKPSRVTHPQAGAVPTSATTALQAVRDHGRLQPGQTVLVIGASGGVGSFAVQIARALGGRVTGVASTGKLEFVRSLGAEHVIDYTAGDITQDGRRYDVVLDIGGNRPLKTLRKMLTPTGTLVFVGGEDGGPIAGGLGRQVRPTLLSRFSKQHFATFWVANPNSSDLDALTAMIEKGQVTPAVQQTRPLTDVVDAMSALEHGAVSGKLVLVP